MSYYDIQKDILEHHGVKGQRWGVRRANKLYEKAKRAHDYSMDAGRESAKADIKLKKLKTKQSKIEYRNQKHEGRYSDQKVLKVAKSVSKAEIKKSQLDYYKYAYEFKGNKLDSKYLRRAQNLIEKYSDVSMADTGELLQRID